MLPGAEFHHYRIVRLLGAGGMGQVYLALNQRLNRREALKVLNPGLSADPSFIQRFEREARHAASIDHRNVVAIYHFDSASKPAWMAMQFVDGTDAAHLIRDNPRGLEPGLAVGIVAQAAEGIDAAHRQDLLHRDIKPANLLISADDGHVRVTDFGIAKVLSSGTKLTETGMVVGTMSYIAPELLLGRPADHRSDIYSLGCTLFELLTGRPPFVGEHPMSVMYAHTQEPVPSATSIRPSLPPTLDTVFATALAKDPEHRFQSCRELAAAAAAALSSAATDVVRSKDSTGPSTELASRSLPPVPPPLPPTRDEAQRRSHQKRWLIVGALVATALVVAAGLWYFRSDTGARPGELSIQPLAVYDDNGNEIPMAAPSAHVDPAGDRNARCDGVKIATVGGLTGPNAWLGINIADGVQLAVYQHNEANPGCQVEVTEIDTEGDPQKANEVVPSAINDKSIIGVVGPGFSSETSATGQLFADAGLVSITPSATTPTLSEQGWETFFRGLANEAVQGRAVANYLTKVRGVRSVCVIEDDTTYGVELARSVREVLGDAALPACASQVKVGDEDFAPVVDKVQGANPEAIFFSGYSPEAAKLVTQLREAGVTATFAAGDAVNDDYFVAEAGDSAKGAILSCPCGEGSEEFREAYLEFTGQAAGLYSAEAYDLATILLAGIDKGEVTRADLLEFVRSYAGQGLKGYYTWLYDGELNKPGVWIYEVK